MSLALPMTKFRPCIDLHGGRVKQIVGGSLRDDGAGPIENHVSEHPAAWFSSKFRADQMTGGHVIQLGPGNREAAHEALAAWPGGLQIGGGISLENAADWLAAGASHVIVTSALFPNGNFSPEILRQFSEQIGRERLVVDLSCRRTPGGWKVAMNRWQTLTDLALDHAALDRIAPFCAELLIHAADVEGLCGGIDEPLVRLLGDWNGQPRIPITYAGGARSIDDLALIERLGHGRIDATIGSALDIFGGRGATYAEMVRWNAGNRATRSA